MTLETSDTSIWIDLDNSPHVPLFVPIIRHYRKVGVDVVITARDHSQTLELLDMAGLAGQYTVIGRHHGGSKLLKLYGTIARAFALLRHIRSHRDRRFGVAVSHGSRAMVLAARMLGIPVLTMYDYEHTETRIFNTFSDQVLVPELIPDEVLDSIGLKKEKRQKYPGLKEELYLRYFTPDPEYRQKFVAENDITLHDSSILVVLRPPATTANYHSTESEAVLKAVLTRLIGDESVFTVIVPRTAEQAHEVEALVGDIGNLERCLILKSAVDGLALAAAADLLISGGGTMNREAALLGVPVYSIFAGQTGTLDRAMELDGRIVRVLTPEAVNSIRLERRVAGDAAAITDAVESFVLSRIDSYLDRS